MQDMPDENVGRTTSAVGEADARKPHAVERAWDRVAGDIRWRAFVDQHRQSLFSALALLVYTVLALIYWWWPIHSAPTNTVIGWNYADVEQSLWYLKWWPYALTHHLNPFLMDKMWVPYGYNLAWQTALLGPSLLLWPVTATAGVVAAYNVLFILSFVLTAWCTFVLCRYLLRQFWASLIGGYLFGFSGYMVAQSADHIFLIFLFFLPLTIYLYLLRRDGKISHVAYIVLAALPLAGLFLTTVELFTLFMLFASGAIALYFVLVPSERKATLLLAAESAGACLLAGVLVSPYLYYMLTGGYGSGAVHDSVLFSGDILGFVVPTNLFLFLSQSFRTLHLAGGNGAEMDSYLGLPLVVIMIVFGVKYWTKPAGKILIVGALAGVAFTLGPMLQLAGHRIVQSPMSYAFKLPIIEKSLPIRYALFVALAGALMAATVIAQQLSALRYKIIAGLVVCIALLPNVPSGQFVDVLDLPVFFNTPMYQQYLKPSDVVLVLPISYGHDMLWQQAANYNFTLSAGYGGEPPHADGIMQIYYMLATSDPLRYLIKSNGKVIGNTYTYYLEQYLASRHVDEIIVGESAYATWSGYLGFLHESPLHVGGIWLYRTPQVFHDASLPGQVVPGDPIARAYTLKGARWDDTTHQLEMLAGTQGEAVETLRDTFASGHYSVTIDLMSAISGPLATADILVDGKHSTALLQNGTTRIAIEVPVSGSIIQIKIASLGTAPFSIGNTVLAQTG
jgi:hypothetical protein